MKPRPSQCLSPASAATLYESLLDDIAAKFASHERSEFWLAFAPGGEWYFSRHYPAARLLSQRGKDLGERLYHIFVDLCGRGYSEIIVADSDSPGVPLSSIDEAYRQLGEDGCDLVLGPSDDGGYYLIGLKRPVQKIFDDIPWSTHTVLENTLARAGELGLKVGLLPPTYDIDVEADLVRLWYDLGRFEELQALAPRTHACLKRLTANGVLRAHVLAPNQVKRKQNGRKR